MHSNIRTARPADHDAIIAVLPDWWSGRDLRPMLPRLFLNHFCNTSLIAEYQDNLVGFLVGFMSPAQPQEAYIHFAGVHPDHRGQHLASNLCQRFFTLCRQNQRTLVRSCTSPENKGSVAFHRKMGFCIDPGDGEVDGLPVTLDYNRPGNHKIRFHKQLYRFSDN